MNQRIQATMKPVFSVSVIRWRRYLFGLLAVVLAGCAPKVQINVIQPAEVDTTGITRVAVGRFDVVEINQVFKIERNGDWQTRRSQLSTEEKEAVANQIRARVVNLLSGTPYFNLNYTDEFQQLENDAALQRAIAAGGYREAEVDAVINGRIWLEVVHSDGVEPDKVPLEYIQGGREKSFHYKVEVLAYWPYKSIRGTLVLETKLTRLNPTEVVAVTLDTRQSSYKLGGKPKSLQDEVLGSARRFGTTLATTRRNQAETVPDALEASDLVLPNFEQIVADLAESIAAQFARRIVATQKEVVYPIASGGNPTARLLIEAGAYERAIDVLNRTLSETERQNPDDIYNLGLCYEATGDFGVAAVTYNDAVQIDPTNLMYAQGLGRLERLRRERFR